MFLDDAVCNGQAQSYPFAFFLGGEKRLEQFGNILFGYAGAGVFKVNLQAVFA